MLDFIKNLKNIFYINLLYIFFNILNIDGPLKGNFVPDIGPLHNK